MGVKIEGEWECLTGLSEGLHRGNNRIQEQQEG